MAVNPSEVRDIIRMNDVQLLTHLLTLAGTAPARAGRLARSLLAPDRSLEQVLALPQDTLMKHPGLGEGPAAFLLLLPALIRRYSSAQASQSIRLEDRSDLERLLLPHFSGQSVERVYAFYLDRDLNLLTGALAAQGGSAAVSCSVRRVLELALRHRAKGVILAHNHPDGSPVFSKSDLLSTSVLFQELALVDVLLLDHYLLAGDRIISLKELSLERKAPPFPFPLPAAWFPPQPT